MCEKVSQEPQPVAWRVSGGLPGLSPLAEALYPASRKDDAHEYARITRGRCQPIYATPSSAGMVSVEAAGWQPIETAPIGVPFLASDGEDMYKAELGSDGIISAWCGQPVVYDVTPTHWMPIPEPPDLAALAGDKP